MLHEADYCYAAFCTFLCDSARDLLTFFVIQHRTYVRPLEFCVGLIVTSFVILHKTYLHLCNSTQDLIISFVILHVAYLHSL
jgi:hypothetical protein